MLENFQFSFIHFVPSSSEKRTNTQQQQRKQRWHITVHNGALLDALSSHKLTSKCFAQKAINYFAQKAPSSFSLSHSHKFVSVSQSCLWESAQQLIEIHVLPFLVTSIHRYGSFLMFIICEWWHHRKTAFYVFLSWDWGGILSEIYVENYIEIFCGIFIGIIIHFVTCYENM